TFLEAEQLAEIIGIDPEVADDMIIFAEEEAERIEREGEPEEEIAAEEAAAGEQPAEGLPSEEAAAIGDGEAAAEPLAPAPAGGFESLCQPEGEVQAAQEAQPTQEEQPPQSAESRQGEADRRPNTE